MKRWLFPLIAISIAAGLALYWLGSDGRPSVAEAAAYFESHYPELELVDTESIENEVIACSFRFSYVRKNAAQFGTIEIQFMADPETGIWRPQPEPNL